MMMKTNARTLLSALSGVALATALLASPAMADDEKKPAKPTKEVQPATPATPASPATTDKTKDKTTDKVKDKEGKDKTTGAIVGEPAPAFTLKDSDGNTVSLADHLKDGKNIVVLEWFNPECPVIVKHHKDGTFNDLHTKYSGKNVVFLGINSGAKGNQGAGADKTKQGKKDLNVPFTILIDESGDVGRAYGAKTTPHCYVIAKDGTLAYNGAIDNQGKDSGKINYVAQAIDELIAGTSVTTPTTRPYGCSVKYAK